MRIGRRFAAGAAAAAVVIALLSWLPAAFKQQPESVQNDVAVFRPESIKRLTNANLVDAIIALQLSGKIESVEWAGAVLSVDLSVTPDPESADAWFDDARKLIRLSFAQTENVNRMIIRYVDSSVERGASPRLIFASDVRRTDEWLSGGVEALSDADPLRDELWRKRLRLNFSPSWERILKDDGREG